MKLGKLFKASAVALTLACGVIGFSRTTVGAAPTNKTSVKEVYAKQNEVTMYKYTMSGKRFDSVKLNRKNNGFELEGKQAMASLQGDIQFGKLNKTGIKNAKVIKGAKKLNTGNIYQGFFKSAKTYKVAVYKDTTKKGMKTVVANVKQGTKMSVKGITKDKKWYKVKVNGKTGYVQVAKTSKSLADSMYERKTPVVQTMFAGNSPLVIKATPEKDGEKVVKVPAGTQFQVTHYCENDWVKVKTRDGKVGYAPLSKLYASNDEWGLGRWVKAKVAKEGSFIEWEKAKGEDYSYIFMPTFRGWLDDKKNK